MPEVLLCADEESLRYPTCLGLPDEALNRQMWLNVCSDAEIARRRVRDKRHREIWIAGSEQMDAVNLAAALRRESPDIRICLLAFQATGSLQSRAHAAGVNEIWDCESFVKNYRMRKQGPVAAPVGQTGAYVLSIVGAGGGVGKSTIAVLSAYYAQALGMKTLLIDADLQFGDLEHLAGVDNTLHVEEVLASPARISQLMPAQRRPAVLAAPKRLEQSEVVQAELPQLIQRLRDNFQVIIVNTGPVWTDMHIQLLETSNNTLFVLDQRPSSVRACKHALDLCNRCGVAANPFLFALNKCARNALFSSIDVSCALQGAHVVELQNGGREVEELLGAGMLLDLVDADNKLCASVEKMIDEILPATGRPEAPRFAPKRSLVPFRRKKAACL